MKKVIVIAGATASGKTNVAIQLANYFNTAIINADSRQCYKEMSIGTAKPTAEEQAQAKHYFVNSHSITDNINVGTFEQLALHHLQTIFTTNNVAIVSGGTGLYINALCNGIDAMPAIDDNISQEINAAYKLKGLTWLQNYVQQTDYNFYNQAEQNNPARLLRALIFKLSTGESILNYRNKTKTERPFTVEQYAILTDKTALHQNINTRVDLMLAAGLVQEVQSLLPYRNSKNLNTVGYTEVMDYLDGKTTLQQCAELIKIHTRQYAKRQLTWFKKDSNYTWLPKAEMVKEITKER